MNINILLPFKEKFDKNQLTPVSITICNNLKYSKFKNSIKVFGRNVENPIYSKNFFGIQTKFLMFFSKNKFIAKKMCDFIEDERSTYQLIELHNRPYLYKYINNRLPKVPISIFFHNDPLTMKGSKSVKDRNYILQNVKAIICVSEFIKNRFLLGINNNSHKVHVLHNGVERLGKVFPKKYKEILYVGRLVEEKGVDLFVKSVSEIAEHHKDWKFIICGSTKLGVESKNSNFAKIVCRDFNNIGKQTILKGFVNSLEVQKLMKRASIVVIPSVWDEPFGLVIIEAMAHGAAIITSNVGGIPEIVGKNGIVINQINSKKITKAMMLLLKDKYELNRFQNLSWENFSLTAKKSSKILDNIRMSFIE